MTQRHKVFISFHHANDQFDKDRFVRVYANVFDGFIDRSVHDGDIDDSLSTETIARKIRDEYIRDATVTIVLIGRETWKRKHVDWEIYSSLRDTKRNPRTGLLGILLSSYSVPWGRWDTQWSDPPRSQYWPYNIPPRLWDNVRCGYAKVRPMPTSSWELQEWIHEAFLRRTRQPDPDLSRDRFAKNRTGNRWYD